ncbi:MAG: DUF6851 domain-containing protein [Pseudomonadota bacterium]
MTYFSGWLWPFYNPFVFGTSRRDDLTLEQKTLGVFTFGGRDTVWVNADAAYINTGSGRDSVEMNASAGVIDLGSGADSLVANGFVKSVIAGRGADTITLNSGAFHVDLGRGADNLTANDFVSYIDAGRGADSVTLTDGVGKVDLGRGRDSLTISKLDGEADGGKGFDTLTLDIAEAGQVDVAVDGDDVTFVGRFSGETFVASDFEQFNIADQSYSLAELIEAYDGDEPLIQVGGGTQTVTVNDPDPTISVIWDRVIQQAVIETGDGPTVASRAYAMMHTAMYDAWSAYDETAVRVSFDAEGDNLEVSGSEADKEKAMSFAAVTILEGLFPGNASIAALVETVMIDRLGFSLEDDGSIAAQIGIDAAEDMLALRNSDGSNQAGGYADNTGYTPFNAGPLEVNDITRWTPENVPVDPEDAVSEQTFLTPQWLNVETFAVPEDANGDTDFSTVRPEAPQPFFTDAFLADNPDATIDFATKEITGMTDGSTISIDKSIIGTVVNEGFIDQALTVIDFSANLTDEDKIIAEFWEDGGGTSFPPGTWMTFAQFVSARDDHSVDQDAQLFMAMGNAVMDAGIATWESKVFYDYARPVRAIRDLGELGLIGEMGVDDVTGETGFVIEAWGGIDPATGFGRGTQTILAENFVTFQLPGGNVSPPFAEYTSGHSAFSAAGAAVLQMFTGSDDFGGQVTFDADSIIFEDGVPDTETTLGWDTFTEAADEAGLSRLYGGIHFEEGDFNGRTLGTEVGTSAFETAQLFINGTATDVDRPFYDPVWDVA